MILSALEGVLVVFDIISISTSLVLSSSSKLPWVLWVSTWCIVSKIVFLLFWVLSWTKFGVNYPGCFLGFFKLICSLWGVGAMRMKSCCWPGRFWGTYLSVDWFVFIVPYFAKVYKAFNFSLLSSSILKVTILTEFNWVTCVELKGF